jgi:hypothetical protein
MRRGSLSAPRRLSIADERTRTADLLQLRVCPNTFLVQYKEYEAVEAEPRRSQEKRLTDV